MKKTFLTVFMIAATVGASEVTNKSMCQSRVEIKICTKADTDSLIRLNSSFLSPSSALSA